MLALGRWGSLLWSRRFALEATLIDAKPGKTLGLRQEFKLSGDGLEFCRSSSKLHGVRENFKNIL